MVEEGAGGVSQVRLGLQGLAGSDVEGVERAFDRRRHQRWGGGVISWLGSAKIHVIGDGRQACWSGLDELKKKTGEYQKCNT